MALSQHEYDVDSDCGNYQGRPSVHDEPDELDVLDLMEKLGGSFVSALATAWRRADPSNRMVLHAAFPHYYELYRDQLKRDRGVRAWQRPSVMVKTQTP